MWPYRTNVSPLGNPYMMCLHVLHIYYNMQGSFRECAQPWETTIHCDVSLAGRIHKTIPEYKLTHIRMEATALDIMKCRRSKCVKKASLIMASGLNLIFLPAICKSNVDKMLQKWCEKMYDPVKYGCLILKWVPVTWLKTEHQHDDIIKWKHFPRHWPFVRGIHRSPGNSPHKGQWRGALIFS